MQKGVAKTGLNKSSKITVGNIFQTMAYNENQVENFSTILNWLSSKGSKISSVFNGALIDKSASSQKFCIGESVVSVESVDAKMLESILMSVKREGEEQTWDEKGALERLEKFERLVKTLHSDLCCVESIAQAIPLWQIAECDQPTWNIQSILNSNFLSQGRRVVEEWWKDGKVLHILMKLRKENYCLRDLLGVITLGVLFQGKFILSISLESGASILPAAYLIDSMNKTNIRKTPIDLLIYTESKEAEKALVSNPLCNHLLVINGNLQDQPLEVVAGVTTVEKARSLHLIVDSTADVESAVDSISVSTWCSGSQVNCRARSLLFIHQPIYKKVIELLEQKMRVLRISSDATKTGDFITRSGEGGLNDLKKILALGVKVFPENSELNGPTLLYDIGTSTEMIANRIPGLGYILCAIPYRSTAELLSLANIYGSSVQTHIYASDSAIVKKLAGNVKSEEIWVNSTGKYNGETNINDWLFFQPKTTPQVKHLQITSKDFGISNAEKALTSWSAMEIDGRLGIAEHVLESLLNKSSGDGWDSHKRLIDLMRIKGRLSNNGGDAEFTISRTNPLGIVGIVVNPGKISVASIILAIMSATVKGNAAIVISVGEPMSKSIVDVCNSNFPVGIVNFVNSEGVTEALKLMQSQGKVAGVWVIQSDSTFGDISLLNNFNRGIVDHEKFIRGAEDIVSLAGIWEQPKIIHW